MKLVLGIDCSTRKTNVGLARDGKAIGEINLDMGRGQASALPLITEKLLSFINLDLNMIDGIAVTVGPGYFTGIRVGISYATALGEGLGVPIIPVCSLEALVNSRVCCNTVHMPLIWSNKKVVYAAAFIFENNRSESLLPAGAYSIQVLEEYLNGTAQPVIMLSPDNERCSELFGKKDIYIRYCPISGSSVAEMGFRRLDSSVDPSRVKARYYREPDIGKPKAPIL